MDIITYALCMKSDKRLYDLITSMEKVTMVVVDSIPTVEEAESNKIYLVDTNHDGVYEEYVLAEIDGVQQIVMLGDITDLSNYYTKGEVNLLLENQVVQVSTMPVASESNVGRVYQYVGADTQDYTKGYFYESVLDNSTYVWEQVNVVGSMSATYTPEGTISQPTTTVTPTTTTMKGITSVGTLPSLTYDSQTEELVLDVGTLPVAGGETTVVTGIQSATTSTPTFTGTQATITVS